MQHRVCTMLANCLIQNRFGLLNYLIFFLFVSNKQWNLTRKKRLDFISQPSIDSECNVSISSSQVVVVFWSVCIKPAELQMFIRQNEHKVMATDQHCSGQVSQSSIYFYFSCNFTSTQWLFPSDFYFVSQVYKMQARNSRTDFNYSIWWIMVYYLPLFHSQSLVSPTNIFGIPTQFTWSPNPWATD